MMNGVAQDRETRRLVLYVANPDSDEPRSPVAPQPPVQSSVRLLPPINTAPSVPHNVVSHPRHISSSGSSSDRSSPTFNTSASSASPITPDSPTPIETLSRQNLLVMVTNDNGSWWEVNLHGALTGASIRELIYSKLKVPDEDYDITVIYRAQVGGGRTSEALDNSALLSTCEQFGDSAGSLQFVLGTISFPRSSAVQQPPSPPELSIPVPLPRIQSKEVQLRDYPDGLGGYEASDEGSSKRSGMITAAHTKHPRRDLSHSPPSAVPQPQPSVANWQGTAPLPQYPRVPVVQPQTRPPRALPQQPSPSRSNHSRTPSDQDAPQYSFSPGGWAGSPTQAPSDRLDAGRSIRRSASSQGSRAPADWPASSGPPVSASTTADASVNPPPRNESREPIPVVNQMQVSPTRLRPPVVLPIRQVQLGPPPATRAPLPPSNKVPYQVPQFIQSSASNSSITSPAAAHAPAQRQQNEGGTAEQNMNRSETPLGDSYRRPGIPVTLAHPYFTPQQRLQSPHMPNGSISISTNLQPQARPGGIPARSPASPRLTGARSVDNLRGARVRPLPHGPTPLRMTSPSASHNQLSGLSQRPHPPSPSSSGSPIGALSSFGALSRGGPAAIDRPLPGILGPSSRRPNTTDSNLQATGLQRAPAISGPRGTLAASRFGNAAAGGGVSEPRGEAAPATGPVTITAAAVSDGAARGVDIVAPAPARSHVMIRGGSGPPAGSALGSAGFHSNSLLSQMTASSVPSSTLLGSGSAPHSPPRPERPQLPPLYVPEPPLTTRDLSGEPMSAAGLAIIAAESGARRGSCELRRDGTYPSPQPNDGPATFPEINWLTSMISEGTILPGQNLSISQPPSNDDLDSSSQRSSGSNTPKSSRHEAGTNLSLGSSTTGDDDSSSDSDTGSEDGTLWQGAQLSASRSQESQDPKIKPNLPPLKTTLPRQDHAWLIRPGPEVLYDHIDKFFPKVNLDEPVIESTPSPTSAEISAIYPPMSPTTAIQSPPPEPVSHDKSHRKSIRVVADERSRKLKHLLKGNFGGKNDTKALGRRVTRFWGNRVEELPPHPKSRGDARVPDTSSTSSSLSSSSTAIERPSPVKFQWVRGDLIGKGSYGRVYHALNATTGEIMAVKQVELPKTPSDHDDKRQLTVVSALKSESATLSTLEHPNVVQYLGFEETPEFLSIFLEYVPGGSIGGCMRKYGRFSEETVKSFTRQVLEGLAYLHGTGILHRDLKGDNILLDPHGVCKITDFGIARHADDIYGDATHTAMQGSIYWMAPEVITNQNSVYSAKIDVWSLGCVVLEMWAGQRPWGGENQISVMFKLGTTKQAPPVPDDVSLGELAEDFRQKCFAIDPANRPTAAELATHSYLVLPSYWAFPGFTKTVEEASPPWLDV